MIRPHYKRQTLEEHFNAHMLLRRAVSAERQLTELRRQHEAIPRVIRLICRMVRGK